MLAEVEASIDFSDEGDVAEVLDAGTTESLRQLSERLLALGRQAVASRRLRDGLSVVIAGPPNAGKSSLLNALVAPRGVAIVSAQPGTTRDLIEAHVDLDGFPMRLIDGAGLRDTDDAVEQKAAPRDAAIQQADIVIWLGGRRMPATESIRVRSKSDLKPPMRRLTNCRSRR